ncbi:hypothetical protein [Brevundimonas vesicularis]|uniref:hypothetical protein n=1 Tax=Brevundimonas vesicularis TaxID=41276 RepID=UPI00082EC4A5|nr:hypothetical protein [Brevundimonas vesicularis]
MSKKPRGGDRKPRSESIYGTTTGEITELNLTVDARTGAISFGQEMTNVYSERSYERAKAPKVLSRMPQPPHAAMFEDSDALATHFDRVFAVDTNTKDIDGRRMSVVGVATLKREVVLGPEKVESGWRFDAPFAIEYGDLVAKPEPFGWMGALEILKQRGFYAAGQRIGLIVDSELGQLKDFNARTVPVDSGEFLPQGVTLIYASSDAGKESVLNSALSIADAAASQILTGLQNGTIPANTTPSGVEAFQSFRVIGVNAVAGPPSLRPRR